MSDQDDRKKPLPLGQLIRSMGKIAAVGFVGGERYYWLINEHGDVSMMPAFVVEGDNHE